MRIFKRYRALPFMSCSHVNLAFFFLGSLIYSLMRFHKCFSTHNTKKQCNMASTVYKQKSQWEEWHRDRAELWPLTFNCWGTLRQMKLPTDTDLEWLLQFPCNGRSYETERRLWSSVDQQDDWPRPADLSSGGQFDVLLECFLCFELKPFSDERANICNILTRWQWYYDMIFNIYQMTSQNVDIHANYSNDVKICN